MPLPGVYETINDGGLGVIPPNPQIQGIVGNCSSGDVEEVKVVGSPTEARSTFGPGSLLEKILDIFSVPGAPSKVYAVRADPTGGQAAASTDIVQSGTGNATTETGGTPTSDRHYMLKVTEGADDDVADGKYQLSVNGGLTYGSEKSFPASATPITLPNGGTITFTNSATPPELVEGDTYAWRTTEVKATTEKMIDAVEKLTEEKDVVRVYVAEGVDNTFGASISTLKASLIALHQYVTFVLEAEGPAQDQATDNWLSATAEPDPAGSPQPRKDWATFEDYTIGVCCGFAYIADIEGNVLIRNLGGVLCGLRCSAAVHESVGWVRKFPVSNIVALYPRDLTDALIETMYDDRFIMFYYVDGNGFRCVEARMMAAETSDFQRLEWLETLYKAVRLTRAKALSWVEGPADPAGMIAFEKDISQPAENMKVLGEIQDYELAVLETDVLGTGEIAAELVIQPIGIMKTIRLTFGLGRVAA
jgi:hypothetical protein